MLQAIQKELVLRKDYLQGEIITSIYWGGGTPSLLDPNSVEKILATISHHYILAPHLEVTLEANPDDITLEKLKGLYSIGVNRLSIGIQSFQDEVLHYMNRVHNGKQAYESVRLAQEAGFENITIDLIYGVPNASPTRWQEDLEKAVALQTTHIAAYCLTIEPKTVFGYRKAQGLLQEIPDEKATQDYKDLIATLTQHGYEHYEISNFSKPGYPSQHNTNYWKKGNYLGVGPGAHSYNGTHRSANIAHNAQYIKDIEQGIIPTTVERLTQKDHINEYIMVSLRTQWGCDLHWLHKKYSYDLQTAQKNYLYQLQKLNLVTLMDGIILLTPSGKLLGDQIARDLFVH